MEPLCDPCADRPVSSHKAPPHKPLAHDILFPASLKRGSMEVPDWKLLSQHMQAEGRVNKSDVIQLSVTAGEIMRKEPNVL
jgi:hypothetical protein